MEIITLGDAELDTISGGDDSQIPTSTAKPLSANNLPAFPADVPNS
jgi:hypothetical protein